MRRKGNRPYLREYRSDQFRIFKRNSAHSEELLYTIMWEGSTIYNIIVWILTVGLYVAQL
jgi:hypothetical protein